MSPQSNDTSGLSLPAPSLEAPHPAMAMQHQGIPASAQQPQYAQPQPPAIQPQPQYAQPAVGPMPQVPVQPEQNHIGIPLQPIAPAAAQPQDEPEDEDDDALDIEWISKAKAIVEQLKLDPFVESNAFNEIKADYLQRRHGKTVKVK